MNCSIIIHKSPVILTSAIYMHAGSEICGQDLARSSFNSVLTTLVFDL